MPASAARREISPTPDLVRAQLARILASAGFVNSRRLSRFLEFVVECTSKGRLLPLR